MCNPETCQENCEQCEFPEIVILTVENRTLKKLLGYLYGNYAGFECLEKRREIEAALNKVIK